MYGVTCSFEPGADVGVDVAVRPKLTLLQMRPHVRRSVYAVTHKFMIFHLCTSYADVLEDRLKAIEDLIKKVS